MNTTMLLLLMVGVCHLQKHLKFKHNNMPDLERLLQSLPKDGIN